MKMLNDYKCEACGHEWEDYCERDDTPLCVECYSTNVKRIVRAPMVAGETPYKTLDKYGVPGQKVTSGPYYHSKTRRH